MAGRGVPIAIRHLKRAALQFGKSDLLYVPSKRRDEKIAVIGAGPAGLMAAWDLAVRGHPVMVFETEPLLGGQINTIPRYHLDPDDLRTDLARWKNLDVTFVTGKRAGIDYTPKSLLAEGYEGFARTALAERAQAAWPPFSRLAAVRDSAPTPGAALEFLSEARRAAGSPSRIKLLGPVPAAMAKRAGRYHAQLLIESSDRTALHRFLDAWLPQMERLPSAKRVRWALDVDPIEMF